MSTQQDTGSNTQRPKEESVKFRARLSINGYSHTNYIRQVGLELNKGIRSLIRV